MASSFIGAWFWDIGTGLIPIIIFYSILFFVMVTSFGLASIIRGRIRSLTLITLGILLNIGYLGLLLVLKQDARQYYAWLALVEGLSSSFYWLALFVLASSWVENRQADWYNGWTGTLEAILGLIIPPLSGWIIATLPGISGYRAVFALAFLSLVGCLALISFGNRPQALPAPRNRREPLPVIPGWHRLLWSFWALGMRDGIYFFVPGLMLYIVTHSTVLLGFFVAMQAAIEGVIFWLLARWSSKISRRTSLRIATLISILAFFVLRRPLNALTLFGLGVLIALAYPSYKIALESSALTAINRYSAHEGDRIQLTGIKEVWINSGRLLSLLILLAVIGLIPHFQIGNLRWILGFWALLPLVILMTYQYVDHEVGP
jgi:YQGE family putative transporter